MKKCKTCKAPIDFGFEDLDKNGEVADPKVVSLASYKVGQCKECYVIGKTDRR